MKINKCLVWQVRFGMSTSCHKISFMGFLKKGFKKRTTIMAGSSVVIEGLFSVTVTAVPVSWHLWLQTTCLPNQFSPACVLVFFLAEFGH